MLDANVLFWTKCFRRIGIEANEELRSIFKRDVHLMLQVRVAKKRNS
jgi:GTPase Era involved in 16S rRNA processing